MSTARKTPPDRNSLEGIAALAELYGQLLDERDLQDVAEVGNSIGGWIAAELALLGSRRIGSVVLVDAVGIAVDDHPIADTSSLSPPELFPELGLP